MLRRVSEVVLFCAALWAAPIHAENITDTAERAQILLDAGDPIAALGVLEDAIEVVWDAAPLSLPTALFVQSASGYGLYVERPEGAVFQPGEVLLVYAEVLGYGYGNTGTGSLTIGFDVDLVLTDTAGEELLSVEKITSVVTPVRYKNREFFITLDLSLSGLPPGDYIMNLLLRDLNSEKSAPIQLAFSVAS